MATGGKREGAKAGRSRKKAAQPGAEAVIHGTDAAAPEGGPRRAAGGMSPLDYMLSVMRDEKVSLTQRMNAAKAAAPYVHSKRDSSELEALGLDQIGEALRELIRRAQGTGGGVAKLVGKR